MAEKDVMVEIDEDEDDKTVSEEDLVVVEEPPEDDEPVKSEETEDDEIGSEREAIRERRRKEKLDRKERRETAIKRDKTELDFLRSRNDDLERRLNLNSFRCINNRHLKRLRLLRLMNELCITLSGSWKTTHGMILKDVMKTLQLLWRLTKHWLKMVIILKRKSIGTN